MGYFEDVYSSPERHGLRILDELDDPEASYSFDMIVVWQHEDGRLFWGGDSGCSCPSPFEGQDSIDHLTEITEDSWADFEKAVKEHCLKWDVHFDTEPPGDGWKRNDLVGRSGTTRRRWFIHHESTGDFAVKKVEMLAKVRAAMRSTPAEITSAPSEQSDEQAAPQS